MTEVTLYIERQDDVELFERLAKRLGLRAVKMPIVIKDLSIRLIPLTLSTERQVKINPVLELAKSLNISMEAPAQQTPETDERSILIEQIMSFQKTESSFGDAATWQRAERGERELFPNR